MKNTAIIIPARLGAKRFPNKPLAKINNFPMIMHVYNRAKESKINKVFVATPDDEIFDLVKFYGGQVFKTKKDHLSGSDRIYEVYENKLETDIDLIINLQGDMPNIKSSSILKLEKLMRKTKSEIGTLASNIKDIEENEDINIVKVDLEKKLEKDNFLVAKNFFRKKPDLKTQHIYHHIGVYAFTNTALKKYVNLPRSKLEIERNLEQMRALENDIEIKVALSDSIPLSVDTEEDLIKVKREMN